MQTIYQGISHLQETIEGAGKVLLVIDSSFPFLNIKDEVEGIKVPYVKFSDFTPNPLYEDVCKGVDLFRREQCDTILAVGGGSSIDVAKCIKLYCKMSDEKLYLEQEYRDTGVKLIAIPTTAGTGSESTRYAVIYYDGKKQSVTHDSIIPNVAILEPQVLKTLPLYQKKCTMLDALCQGIESWWSVNSTEDSKRHSRIAVETIMQWWRQYIFDYTEEAARHIMTAANEAGQAICITQTTAPHAFSYKITSLYELPHGHAVAVCLKEIWDYMLQHIDDCIDTRGSFYLKEIFTQIAKSMECGSMEEAVSCFRNLLDNLGMNSPITTNRRHDLDILASTVNPIRLRNNPVELNVNSIYSLYDRIVH
ncbi:MAG: phosphonoacetaldehyde reductase [Prevotella sp.]|nr:phosphonoacetaldehyde reductase [Prevotella sp.]